MDGFDGAQRQEGGNSGTYVQKGDLYVRAHIEEQLGIEGVRASQKRDNAEHADCLEDRQQMARQVV